MMSEARFRAAQHSLHEGEAHVWSIPFTPSLPSGDELATCLSHTEIARAARMRDAVARARFITTRIAVRHILARYLGASAAALDVLVEARGKPVLDAAHGVHFSLSHARHITLLAVAETAVGIDVEHIRAPRRLERTARRILHRDTCLLLDQLPVHQRADLFLHAWTQREAHVKAVGGGLFHTPDTLPFVPGIDADGAIQHVHDRSDDTYWSIARFRPDSSSLAAIAALGSLHTLRFFSWTPDEREIDNE